MAVSELPGNPNAVWTVKRHIDGERTSGRVSFLFHSLLICDAAHCLPSFLGVDSRV